MADARFEDGRERPLRLEATDPEGLQVISALVQDAVFPMAEVTWHPRKRDFAILLNRFRWEDKPRAEVRGRPYERVQSVLRVADATHVASQGVDPRDRDTILSVLSLTWEPGEDGAGRVIVTLSGDGAIAISAECVNVTLIDVTRPYVAPSGKAPRHDT